MARVINIVTVNAGVLDSIKSFILNDDEVLQQNQVARVEKIFIETAEKLSGETLDEDEIEDAMGFGFEYEDTKLFLNWSDVEEVSTDKPEVECPECGSVDTIEYDRDFNDLKVRMIYQCKDCEHTFYID